MRQASIGSSSGRNTSLPTIAATNLFLLKAPCPTSWPITKSPVHAAPAKIQANGRRNHGAARLATQASMTATEEKTTPLHAFFSSISNTYKISKSFMRCAGTETGLHPNAQIYHVDSTKLIATYERGGIQLRDDLICINRDLPVQTSLSSLMVQGTGHIPSSVGS